MKENLDQLEGLVRAPHGNATGDTAANVQLALAAAVSSTLQTLPACPPGGRYISFICDAAWTLRVSTSNAVGAAVAADFPIPANTQKDFWFSQDELYFRAFSTAGGTLNYYVSGYAGN